MTLSWKDGVDTVLALAVVVVGYAWLYASGWSILRNWRIGCLALLILGLASCIVSSYGAVASGGAWIAIGNALGGIAFLLGVLGLIFNNKFIFIVLASDILLLWVVSTIHHLVSK